MTADQMLQEGVAVARRVLAGSVMADPDAERLAYLLLELDREARAGRMPRSWTPFTPDASDVAAMADRDFR